MLTRGEDYAHNAPLTKKKQRQLELTAGAKRGRRPLLGSGH